MSDLLISQKNAPSESKLPMAAVTLIGLLIGSLGTILLGLTSRRQEMVFGMPESPAPASNSTAWYALLLALSPTLIATLFLGLSPFLARRKLTEGRGILNLGNRLAWSIILGTFLAAVIPLLAVLGSTDTEFAPGYTERAFARVAIGDSKADVRALLGEPLEIIRYPFSERRTARDPHQIYVYSRSPSSSHFRLRQIWFDEQGQVSFIRHEFYWD